MIKFTLAFLAAGAFAAASAFAGEGKACCAHGASGKMTKAECSATFAKLDLTAEQKTKMEKLAADCEKAGCTKESMAMMEKEAKAILSEDQFAAWQTACAAKKSEKTT